MAEAVKEPVSHAGPFPIRHYESILESQRVIVRFLGLLVAALRNIDAYALPVQAQYMSISFEQIQKHIAVSLDTVARIMSVGDMKKLKGSKFEQVLDGDCVRLEHSLKVRFVLIVSIGISFCTCTLS